jgi:hypothetical protein
MKILTKTLTVITIFVAHNLSAADGKNIISNYKIEFTKEKESENSLHIRCEFDINLTQALLNDTCIEMKFGGQSEYATDDSTFTVSTYPHVDYVYDPEQKTIKFYPANNTYSHVVMEYDFLSFSSAFIYRNVCEIWETSFSEYYYPFIFGEKSLFDVTVTVPVEYSVINGYHFLEKETHTDVKIYHYKTEYPVVSHSCVFAILPDSSYTNITYNLNNFEVETYLLKDVNVPNKRITELLDLTSASIDFFSKSFGEYDNKQLGIDNKLTYIFHKNDFSNRNVLNFIIASQYKFAQKPHILPLVHEIGHRWFGEWTLLIEDGEYGAYFIKESLNEHLSVLFAKNYYGQEFFDYFIDSCHTQYNKIKGSEKDKSLYEMKFNNNITVVYHKGTLVINEIVKIMGEEKWLLFMNDFYSKYAGKPDLKYENFIELLKITDEPSAILLDAFVKENIQLTNK